MKTRVLTRRAFTAMAASCALQAEGARIRTAVIGTGHGHAISKIRALRSMPEYELVGVCRPDSSEPELPAALRELRALSLQEVLNDSTIEMVAIETADFDRNLLYAEQFVDAGRFVHFDKPPGSDLQRFRKLLANAESRKRVVQMGYQWRYQSAMQACVEAAQKGWLGKLYRFHASIDKLVGREERLQLAKYRGGLMFTEGCHLVDRAVAVLGRPRKVTGILRHDSTVPDGLADNTVAILEYDTALAEISLAGFRSNGTPYRYLEILGANGSVRAQPYAYPTRLTVDLVEAAGPYKAGPQRLEPPAPPGLTYTPDFRELANIIRNGASPSVTSEHDIVTHETLLRVIGVQPS